MAFSKNLGSANSTSKGRWRSGEVEDAVLKHVDFSIGFHTFQVVQDFSHQQYCSLALTT